jgi:NTP pyrophosphatase (non-canonical NTP hydrolase)
MTFNNYQTNASRTAFYPRNFKNEGLYYTTLGLVGEAGEIANKVKKIMRDNNGKLEEINKADIFDELGDVLWYCASLADELGVNLEDVAKCNLNKLADRLNRGKIGGSGDKR